MNQKSIEVLLVEDDPDDAELTIRALKKHNLANHLLHVKDGEEALNFLFAKGAYEKTRDLASPPRIILLDIQMPKVNGLEVLQQVKSDPRTKMTPVVVLTSSKQDPDIQKCYALGANSYIVKPVSFERFADAIRDLGYYWLILNTPPA
ncbi:MAG: response regulator [Puia sp.]|nr:response regulator [Puia sp.]